MQQKKQKANFTSFSISLMDNNTGKLYEIRVACAFACAFFMDFFACALSPVPCQIDIDIYIGCIVLDGGGKWLYFLYFIKHLICISDY